MGLYTQIEKNGNKRQVSYYEKIIKKINSYYNDFCDIFKKDLDTELNVEELLKEGNFDFDIEDFITKVDQLNHKYINIIFNRLVDDEVQTESKTTIEKLDILSSLDNRYFQDRNIKIPLFLMATSVLPNYYSLPPKEEFLKQQEDGKDIFEIYSDFWKENNIEIKPKLILAALKERMIINQNILKEKIKYEYVKKEFIANTERLKQYVKDEIAKGKDVEHILTEILPEAYGLVKAACEYSLNKTPYDVQLMGAIALNEGKVSEMYTGEGKTITSILPAYLNALTGREVDIFTPNDYLAKRDAENNSKVFNLLGLSVGCVLVDGQTTEEKQQAYKCDIVYGSSTAFAFDFLYDTNEHNVNNLVQREEKPGFVIVDEADQILINNALSPYQLKTGGKLLTKKQQRENNQVMAYLETALELEKILSKKAYTAKNQYEYECITGDNKEETERMNEKYSILIGQDDVYITQKGERELFYNYFVDEILELSNRAKEIIITDSNYEENEDYVIIKDRIVLTPTGVEKASSEIREFQDLQMKWLSDEACQVQKRYVLNALRAEYLMKKGKDYQVVTNEETGKEEVVVLQDGRILPNSKFTNGLHQAIELKEGLGVQLDKGETLADDSVASISNRALLSRYEKISGMTGTADKTAFYEIYSLDTFEVPKNKEYQYKKGIISQVPKKRKDNPTRLYKNEKAKYDGLIKDILESNKKGQPVLVVTDNEEDAKKLYSMLEEIKNLTPNLLTSANTLEEEAQIISNAGALGAVTIATEIAGRGTDIKLGGEKETNLEELRRQVFINQIIDRKAQKNMVDFPEEGKEDFQVKEKYIKAWKEILYDDPTHFDKEIEAMEQRYQNDQEYSFEIDKLIIEEHKKEIEIIQASGGLKYIQMNPFKTTRNDNQGRGRVARQGEPGETILYASLDDLKNIGVDKEQLEEASNMFFADVVVTDDLEEEGRITEIIEDAQLRNEFDIDMAIASTDTMDYAMSSLGMSLLRDRKSILSVDDPNIIFDNMVDSVIDTVLKESVPEKRKKKVDKDSYKLSKLNLDFDNLSIELKSIFGMELDENSIYIECMDVGDLKDYLFDKAKAKQKENNLGVPETKQQNNIKNALVTNVNEVYNNFIYSAENVRLQELNDMIAQNTSHNRTKELNDIYLECVHDGWKNCVSSVFRPGLKKKEVYSEQVEIDPDVKDDTLSTIEEIKARGK